MTYQLDTECKHSYFSARSGVVVKVENKMTETSTPVDFIELGERTGAVYVADKTDVSGLHSTTHASLQRGKGVQT